MGKGRDMLVGRARRGRRFDRRLLLIALLLSARPIAGQGATATVRGRVLDRAGAPLEDVRIEVQSPALTRERATRSGARGDYAMSGLPPGDYVVTFAHDGRVTVKQVLHLDALESAVVDAVLVAAERDDQLITVRIASESFPSTSAAAASVTGDGLRRLPVEGGIMSALGLAPAGLGVDTADVLVAIDGSAVKFFQPGASPPLLDPGAPAFQEATLVYGVPGRELGRLRAGAVSVATRPGADRVAGLARVTLAPGNGARRDVEHAPAMQNVGRGVEVGAGAPLDARRTWLFGALRRRSDAIETQPLLSSTRFAGRAIDDFWQIKATHAVAADQRLQAQAMMGARRLQAVPPLGAATVEEASALESRDVTHHLLAASDDLVLGRTTQVTLRLSTEARRATTRDARGGVSRIVDRETGAVAGNGGCAGCPLDDRSSTSVEGSIQRLLDLGPGQHLIAAGANVTRGGIALSGAGPDAAERLASRFVVHSGRIDPIFEANGSSWLVTGGAGAVLHHASDSVFVQDDWRAAPHVAVQAGLRWDRQRLEAPMEQQRPPIARSGIGPRLHVSWQPRGDDRWTVSTGVAHYEAELLDLVGEGSTPVGAWTAYGTGDAASPRFTGIDAPWAALTGRAASALAPTFEWTAGTSHRLGTTFDLRADVIARWSRPLPTPDSWAELDATARSFERPADVDLGLLTRRYAALVVQSRYVFGLQAEMAASYTLARAWGEPVDSAAGRAIGPWAAPSGDLAADRRHQLDLWGHVTFIESASQGTLTLGALHTLRSGQPFGFVSWVDVSRGASAGGSTTARVLLPYYLTARDAFRAEAVARSDLSLSYRRLVPGALRTMAFVEVHVLNAFGKRHILYPDDLAAARTAFSEPSAFRPIDPFVDVPIEGVDWAKDVRLPSPEARPDGAARLSMPRTYAVTIGVTF